ncbi:hypothetical protein TWF481_007606 [Arthrobotrys musiformis]|uniref:Uncharacterized protein n=1 Tax=Arthrobotrys musiformis TaxID=47236 RepID=A0AAV9WBZ3_9PEZI
MAYYGSSQREYERQLALQYNYGDNHHKLQARSNDNYDHYAQQHPTQDGGYYQHGSQQRGDYDHHYSAQQHGEYGHYHGSQQGYQPQSFGEAAGPSSLSSNHRQARRHKRSKNIYEGEGETQIEKKNWECHYCGTHWHTDRQPSCQTIGNDPNCFGHQPCSKCNRW